MTKKQVSHLIPVVSILFFAMAANAQAEFRNPPRSRSAVLNGPITNPGAEFP